MKGQQYFICFKMDSKHHVRIISKDEMPNFCQGINVVVTDFYKINVMEDGNVGFLKVNFLDMLDK